MGFLAYFQTGAKILGGVVWSLLCLAGWWWAASATSTAIMTNSSNNSTFQVDITAAGVAIHSTTFVISLTMLALCIIGAYGNVISIIVFSHRTMKAPINVLLKALSVIDTALILSSIVVFIVPNLNLTLQNARLRSACEFASLYLYPLSMTAQSCSVWTFVLVSCTDKVVISWW